MWGGKAFLKCFFKSGEERRLFNSIQEISPSCQAAVGAQALEFTVGECNHLAGKHCQEAKGGEASLGWDSVTDLPGENPNLQSSSARTWLHRHSLLSPGHSENNNRGIKVEKFGLEIIRLGEKKRGYSHPAITQKALIGSDTWILEEYVKLWFFFSLTV